MFHIQKFHCISTDKAIIVKQSIGWTNVLPWSWLWRRTGPLRPKYQWREVNAHHEIALTFDRDALTHPGSPEGGVILYWLTTVVWICLTASSTNTPYAVSFSGNMLIYGHFFVEGERTRFEMPSRTDAICSTCGYGFHLVRSISRSIPDHGIPCTELV